MPAETRIAVIEAGKIKALERRSPPRKASKVMVQALRELATPPCWKTVDGLARKS